jgi:anti-sigma factor RsiW
MDYITHRLSAQDRIRVEEHLQKCPQCENEYQELLLTENSLKQSQHFEPAPVYYTTILPRVRERLVERRRVDWKEKYGIARIILPLAVSAFLLLFLIKVPINYTSDFTSTEALHQAVHDLNDDEVVQAVEKAYTGASVSPTQEVAAAGVSEHLQGNRFLKTALSRQIDNEEIADIDIEGIISDLNGEQVEQVLSGLSERNIL